MRQVYSSGSFEIMIAFAIYVVNTKRNTFSDVIQVTIKHFSDVKMESKRDGGEMGLYPQ